MGDLCTRCSGSIRRTSVLASEFFPGGGIKKSEGGAENIPNPNPAGSRIFRRARREWPGRNAPPGGRSDWPTRYRTYPLSIRHLSLFWLGRLLAVRDGYPRILQTLGVVRAGAREVVAFGVRRSTPRRSCGCNIELSIILAFSLPSGLRPHACDPAGAGDMGSDDEDEWSKSTSDNPDKDSALPTESELTLESATGV